MGRCCRTGRQLCFNPHTLAVDSAGKNRTIAVHFFRLDAPHATDCDSGWTEPDPEQFRTRVGEAVAGDSWVCEGNYARRTFDLRLPRAQLVIWLDTPRLTCLKRVIVRSVLDRPRPDRAAGCKEQLDKAFLEFLRFVWQFDRGYRPGIEAMRLAVAPEVRTVHLRGEQQIRDFLEHLDSAVTLADGMP